MICYIFVTFMNSIPTFNWTKSCMRRNITKNYNASKLIMHGTWECRRPWGLDASLNTDQVLLVERSTHADLVGISFMSDLQLCHLGDADSDASHGSQYKDAGQWFQECSIIVITVDVCQHTNLARCHLVVQVINVRPATQTILSNNDKFGLL